MDAGKRLAAFHFHGVADGLAALGHRAAVGAGEGAQQPDIANRVVVVVAERERDQGFRAEAAPVATTAMKFSSRSPARFPGDRRPARCWTAMRSMRDRCRTMARVGSRRSWRNSCSQRVWPSARPAASSENIFHATAATTRMTNSQMSLFLNSRAAGRPENPPLSANAGRFDAKKPSTHFLALRRRRNERLDFPLNSPNGKWLRSKATISDNMAAKQTAAGLLPATPHKKMGEQICRQ